LDLHRTKSADAAAFARTYLERFIDLEVADNVRNRRDGSRPFDFGIASHDELTFLTKRAMLVADQMFLSHAKSHPLYQLRNFSRAGYPGTWETVKEEVHAPQLGVLGRYLLDCMPIFEDGQFLYYPNVQRTIARFDNEDPLGSGEGMGPFSTNTNQVIDLVVQGNRLVEVAARAYVQGKVIKPLLVLDLPSIEGTTLADFCKITTQESESLAPLQAFLREKLLAIDDEPQAASVEAARLSVEIRDGVRAVQSEMRRLTRRSAVQHAGAGLATITASLIAIAGVDLAATLSLLGASGGLWGIVASRESYLHEKSLLRERPFYLLWVLSKSAKPVLGGA
jgi:hypothetical protein